jgi:parallel beta-helix repeat protein
MKRTVVWTLAALLGILLIHPSLVSLDADASSHYTLRGPILIDGNGAFTADNGVVSGSGTPDDPYVIEGWEIDATLADGGVDPYTANGIEIRNTDAHFVIRDVYVHSALYGVLLRDASNGRIEGVTITGNRHGIDIGSSLGITVSDSSVTENIVNGIIAGSTSQLIIAGNRISGNGFGDRYGGVAIGLFASSDVAIRNNEVSGNRDDGIAIADSTGNITLAGNTVQGHRFGIEVRGSSGITLEDNDISMNEEAVVLIDSNSSSLEKNRIFDNGLGIRLDAASNIVISGNNLSSNNRGISVITEVRDLKVLENVFVSNGISFGLLSAEYYGTFEITTDNLVNGKPLYFFEGCSSLKVAGISVGQLVVANCSDVRVANLEIAGTDTGIFFAFVEGAVIEDNRVSSNNEDGITLRSSSNVTIRRNVISLNGRYGLFLDQSSRVRVYGNDFIGNGGQAWVVGGVDNVWDDGYPNGGNFWSDYPGEDKCSGPDQDVCPDPDGIGDTPHTIDSIVVDRYPLMRPMGERIQPPPFNLLLLVAIIAVSVVVLAAAVVFVILPLWRKRKQG